MAHVTLDPENPAHALERMPAHELHRCSRWDGPGYGKTLGEALVSEGLAGHFAQEVFGGEPESWEQLPASSLHPYLSRAQADWQSAGYDHAAWFFGSSDLPGWLGYSFGYQAVGRYLAAYGDARASKLVHADAKDFRAYLGVA